MNPMLLPFLIVSASFFTLAIRCLSLEYRHFHLRRELLRRMTRNEIQQLNQTDQDFWSFLK